MKLSHLKHVIREELKRLKGNVSERKYILQENLVCWTSTSDCDCGIMWGGDCGTQTTSHYCNGGSSTSGCDCSGCGGGITAPDSGPDRGPSRTPTANRPNIPKRHTRRK